MQAKRRVVGFAAAALALTAVVGSGFSAWVFSTEQRQDINVGVQIEHATRFGVMGEQKNNYRLKLDQYDEGTDYNVSTIGNVDQGISLLQQTNGTGNYVAATTLSAVWTVSANGYNDTLSGEGDAQTSSVKYFLNIWIKNDTLGKYVAVKTGVTTGFGTTLQAPASASSGHDHTGYTGYQKALDATKVDNDDDTYSFTITYTIADNLFVYLANNKEDTNKPGKPTTFDEYKTMVATLTGGNPTASNVQPGQQYLVNDDAANLIFEFVVVNSALVNMG